MAPARAMQSIEMAIASRLIYEAFMGLRERRLMVVIYLALCELRDCGTEPGVLKIARLHLQRRLAGPRAELDPQETPPARRHLRAVQ
jgi:hypothetical protein